MRATEVGLKRSPLEGGYEGVALVNQKTSLGVSGSTEGPLRERLLEITGGGDYRYNRVCGVGDLSIPN